MLVFLDSSSPRFSAVVFDPGVLRPVLLIRERIAFTSRSSSATLVSVLFLGLRFCGAAYRQFRPVFVHRVHLVEKISGDGIHRTLRNRQGSHARFTSSGFCAPPPATGRSVAIPMKLVILCQLIVINMASKERVPLFYSGVGGMKRTTTGSYSKASEAGTTDMRLRLR